MKRIWLLGILIGIMVGLPIGLAISASSQPNPSQTANNMPKIAELLSLVNIERAKNGVAPLKEDPRLDASGQMKANDEIAYSYYDHESSKSPNHDGNSHYFIFSTGISCVDSSENLDENSTSKAAVQAWIGSAAHHTAMINAKYSTTGFGIAGPDKKGYYQFVEHFCQTP